MKLLTVSRTVNVDVDVEVELDGTDLEDALEDYMESKKCAGCQNGTGSLCDKCSHQCLVLFDQGFTPEKIACGKKSVAKAIRAAFPKRFTEKVAA